MSETLKLTRLIAFFLAFF